MADKLVLKGVMSEGYGVIPKLVMKDRDLDVVAKTFYAYLCSYAGQGNTAFPSIKTICYDLNISDNRLFRYRKALVDKGYISVEQEKEDGKWGRNVYTLEPFVKPKPQNENLQKPNLQNVDTQNVDTQNEGTNNNSTNNNSTNNNSTNNKTSAKPPSASKVKYEESNPYYQLANYLYQSILKNDPKAKQPNMQTWSDEIRKLVEIDERDIMDVKDIVTFATNHHFWKKNILSTKKLRDKFSTLYIEFNDKHKSYGQKKYQQPTQQVTSIKQPSSFTPTEPDENGFNGCNFEISWIGKRNIDHNLIIHYYKEHIKNTGALLKSGGREITVQELIEEIEWDRKVKVSV